jgi:hypothetical protein
MNKLLVIIPYCTNDGAQAERLIDFIFTLNDRNPSGHCLLVAAPEVHAEMKTKIQISAEVTFETSSMIEIGAWSKPSVIKPQKTNEIFEFAAKYIHEHSDWPFLWLEPDCAPLKAGWLDTLTAAYFNQPKKFFGSFMQFKLKRGDEEIKKICMARVGIYPNDAADIMKLDFNSITPFEFPTCDRVIPKATKTWLIQQSNYRLATDKIKGESVLLHSDKNGLLLKV